MLVPVGTKIVSNVPIAGANAAYAAGTVAEVVATPTDATHAYRVRLADGFESNLTREQFVQLHTLQNSGLSRDEVALEDHALADSIIYRCVVGSRAYGLSREGSDTDTRGIYLPPAPDHWSLYGVPEQLENRATDEVYWELQKFLILALKANPNILEVLHTPEVVSTTPLADELIGMRATFVSKLVFQTYNGYVMSQFKKMQRRIEQELEMNWKHAMHLIRLLLSGITALRTGVVPVRVDESHRERLLEIRAGDATFESVDRWRLELQREFDGAYATTNLPERPDYPMVNDFLIRARRSVVADN